ncbi:hypothetical protein [Aporhodopirellula aestuarii]|uniref:Secreted protein n=1 Tax=Aporhodopirellula aestuarii TaxID=2950107 RepID=A0ABT0UE38_9BACT|nr:hypothetical protein [Aporhodopirellula aestuarii]MCM2374546.1 hypothetical protein [Aporhodopirellula aestuarii]
MNQVLQRLWSARWLVLVAVLPLGCSDDSPRRVTDGVDIEAIRAYEADHNRVQQLNDSSDMNAVD